jgi:hypothetical protein
MYVVGRMVRFKYVCWGYVCWGYVCWGYVCWGYVCWGYGGTDTGSTPKLQVITSCNYTSTHEAGYGKVQIRMFASMIRYQYWE